MLDERSSVTLQTNVALVASQQVLEQQEKFERIMAERQQRDQAKKAAREEAVREATSRNAEKLQEAAVVVDLSKSAAPAAKATESQGGTPTPSQAAASSTPPAAPALNISV